MSATTKQLTLSHEDAVARAKALRPVVAARSAEGEQLRRLPEATIADLDAAGFDALLVPPSLGGHGLGLVTLLEVTEHLAAGDASTGWVASFYALHNWLVTKFAAEARRDVLGERGWARVPAPLAPTGKAEVVEGGYLIEGRWSWATGVMHADWTLVHAVLATDDRIDFLFCLVPMDEVEVSDTWRTTGMRATGSNDVSVENVFVPEHRVVSFRGLVNGGVADDLPGETPLRHYPLGPVLSLTASASALGAASGAVDVFAERLRERVLANTLGDKQVEDPAAHIRLAECRTLVQTARALLLHEAEHFESAQARGPIEPADRARYRTAAAQVVRLSREAIGWACEAAGASVYAETHPLARFQRDVETLKGHLVFDWDRTMTLAGRVELGLDIGPGELL